MATDVAEASTTRLIGSPVKRVEDPRLMTGAARYLDDLRIPGMAHVAILRSPYAHARIRGIDTGRAAGAPGVIGVFTGKDFEHLNPLPCAWQAGGTENFVATPRALEIDRVTFTGAGVAAVVAETKTRCISPQVGGGFGTKIFLYPEYVLMAALAEKVRRPVKWMETRRENYAATTHGRDHITYLEVGAGRDGTITALKVKTFAN